MSSPQQNHPEQNVLTDFGLGRLDPADSSWIEEHLSECKECCDTLLNLKDDTFAGMVRSLPKPEEAKAEQVEPALPPTTETGATDGAANDDESVHAATMLVQSGEEIEPSELPAELQDHPRYQIVEQIGQGGMGAVYRAQHRLMNRPVALKLINSQLIRHPQAVERFRREVQAAAQLAHPNIVAAYDAEQAGAVHFLAMEFVEGTDLADVVSRRGQLPVREACDYIRQAAEGLQHAHEKGMVHRDIKPHNLMLSPDGKVRILDFGLAGFATESALIEADAAESTDGDTTPLHLTTFGSVMGTPDYIAPEQARDAHSADIRADIYSLGCTLCYLLTGNAPFEADAVVDKLKAHVDQEPPTLSDLRDDVSAELADIVSRMMAKDPVDRFQTPNEVATALAPFVAKGTHSASVAPPHSGFRRWVSSPAAWFFTLLLAGAIYVATDNGRIEINSDADVEVSIMKDGKEVKVIDVQSGTEVFWLSTGKYRIVPKGDAVVSLSRQSVTISRLGKEPLTIEAVDTMSMKEDALAALKPWLRLLDDEKYGECWDNMADFAHEDISRESFNKSCSIIHHMMGKTVARKIESQKYAKSLPRVGRGHFVTFRYGSNFEKYPKMREQAVLVQGKDQKWKVLSYFATLPSKLERDPSLSDQQQIQGTWITQSVERGNQSVPIEQVGMQRVVFNGDTANIFTPGGIKSEGVFELKTAKDPKEIWLRGGANREVTCGIYKLEGNRLTLCMSHGQPTKVPTKFDSSVGTRTDMIVLRRVSRVGERPTPPDNVQIQGKWSSLSVIDNGEQVPQMELTERFMTFSGDRFTGPKKRQPLPGKFTLDPTTDPKQIDLHFPSGPKSFIHIRGIYRLEGDRLTIFQSTDWTASKRPTSFESKPGDKRSLLVFERVPDWGSLQGTWKAVALEAAGQNEPERAFMGRYMVFRGGRVTRVGTLRDVEAFLDVRDFRIDPSVSPKTLDISTTDDGEFAEFSQSIYEIDGDTLRVCFAQQSELPRPTSFDTTGTRYFCFTLKRTERESDQTPPEHSHLTTARAVVLGWLEDFDKGAFATCWDTMTNSAKANTTKENGIAGLKSKSESQGRLQSREFRSAEFVTANTEAPPRYIVVTFDTQFETTGASVERISTVLDPDGRWRVAGYGIKRTPLIARPSWQPEYGTGPIKPGVNLVNDPSLEGTAPGQLYPKTWGNGNLIPKDAWRFEVIEGGRTGKRGWMIEGDGTAATVPSNRQPVDRAFRYAARAWVKVESGMARLGLLYFDKNRRYIDGRSSSATTARLGEWHQLTMVDDFAKHPDAAYVSLALIMVGPGKVVFDDLELIPFDANNLPENFEEEYAAPTHDPAMFDRWVGRWETTVEHPRVDGGQRTIKGSAVVRKILDDRFLLWHWASDTGNDEYLRLTGFDEHIGAYRDWGADSNGFIYERNGSWNASTGTLTLHKHSPDSGTSETATDRFVGPDRVETLLTARLSEGQTDGETRATWTRKSGTVEGDIPVSTGPAADTNELAVLQKLAGRWKAETTLKPSVWEPDGKTEVNTERSEWVLGGRALLMRGFDKDHEQLSLSLTTWNPQGNSYRMVFFSPTTFGGRWSIAWDEPAKAFRWQATDMPTGWIGTGFDRSIDDDTFDNQLLIKDEQGRVLMDSHQKRSRVK